MTPGDMFATFGDVRVSNIQAGVIGSGVEMMHGITVERDGTTLTAFITKEKAHALVKEILKEFGPLEGAVHSEEAPKKKPRPYVQYPADKPIAHHVALRIKTALSKLGFRTLADFQASIGVESNNMWGPEIAKALWAVSEGAQDGLRFRQLFGRR